MDLPATAESLREYRRGGVQALAAGGLLTALGVGVGVLSGLDGGWSRSVTSVIVGLGLTALCAGSFSWPMARRFRRVLGARAWSAHAAVAVADDWKGETVVLAAPDGEERWTLRVIASRTRWTPVRPVAPGVLWWCGDPRVGGVLALPGGGPLFWARPLRGEAVRRRVLDHAEGAGLSALEVPDPPDHRAASLAFPAAPPAEVAAARRKELRRRLTGRWRWVVLPFAVVLALAWNWIGAADADPQTDLTVVSEEADGDCVVRWKDPWDGRERTGPFACDPTRDPLLVGSWETAFVVSYGPWKGDLYGYVGERRVGSDPDGTVGALATVGFFGVLGGLAVGWWSFWHRRGALRRAAPTGVVPREPQEAVGS
ncbi:hypothetical protein [Streptomyces sp. NPDC047974]|uniref:hypothetical protein n=1 Tax=Streptomyces sp. NPDC047974 TaxID=3154343 RepID=UPI0033E78D71